MSRRRREKAILALVDSRPVRTQAELVDALEEEGFEASQSTVSRDIKRLGLVKVPAGDGGYRYGRPREGPAPEAAEERLRAAVAEFVTDTVEGSSLLALKTPPGGADAVAVALDRAGLEEVAATLAGDDTVLVLVREGADRDALRRRLRSWM